MFSGKPVHPPKIDAVLLVAVVGVAEIRLYKSRVPKIEIDFLPVLPVDAKRFCHGQIVLFMRGDALPVMEIGRHGQPLFMQPAEKGPVIGEQLPVPGVADQPVPYFLSMSVMCQSISSTATDSGTCFSANFSISA